MHRPALRSTIGFVLALAGVSAALFAQPAAAATQSFFFTGGEQTYTVPAGVSSVHVVAIGARGGKGADEGNGTAFGGIPGFGARVEADILVTPGQVLFVEVGGTGTDGVKNGAVGTGGFNGGGSSSSGVFSTPGGGGGGATDLRACSFLSATCSSAANSLGSRLLVAGGGGGGGANGRNDTPNGGAGGNGGLAGTTGEFGGSPNGGGGGGAGTLTAGGAGGAAAAGAFGPSLPGNPGSFGQGGAANAATGGMSGNNEPGGGGGGGYYGGGAGGSAGSGGGGGGGGGSSFTSAAASKVTTTSDTSGAAQMVISTNPNKLTLGKLKKNKKKGTATISVDVSGPGTVSLTGAGLVKQRPVSFQRGARLLSKTVTEAGTVTLKVKAKGKKKTRLLDKGKVKVKAKITYKPTGATAITSTKRITLKKAL
jgi:hypothetical protein